MKRRLFFKRGLLASIGTAMAPSFSLLGNTLKNQGKAKNVIFMVSDGMSMGTLSMADLLHRRKNDTPSTWVSLYQQGKVARAIMDTASANSIVTDSAAAGSSWGGGMRVNNGAINVGPMGEKPMPILQKFKNAGKSVGCVTTVPVTHATPASFCVNVPDRNDQAGIAEEYLKLRFDLWLGGGAKYFDSQKRTDGKDMFGQFAAAGYQVVKDKDALKKLNPGSGPVLGTFAEDALPYTIDRNNQQLLGDQVPSLAEMTQKAIGLLGTNDRGFMLQVEGGKVDWAAHGNDTPALLYDQLDFDEAVKVAMDFAEQDGETLVIITTDHGNGEPGVFYGDKADDNFDSLLGVGCSNEWVLNQIDSNFSPKQVIELLDVHQQVRLAVPEARLILDKYQNLEKTGLYNPRKLPFELLATYQERDFSVHWANNEHSGVFVELSVFGPGSDKLPGMMENYKLHDFILETAEI
ncbi:alkaline phosphatase [Belliella marina]|uniref:Alkaline phosphatase n=1 Tax=Belliella marina TaxID=1644146 RepID=A0ABW4VME9_9BACT